MSSILIKFQTDALTSWLFFAVVGTPMKGGHLTQSSTRHSPVTSRSTKPYLLAVHTALNVIPPRLAGVQLVGPGLMELCLDSRFGLKRISHAGLSRAEGVLKSLENMPDARAEALRVNYDVIAELGANDPMGVVPVLLVLSHRTELVQHVRHAVGVLGIARMCSENLEQILLTREAYEHWRRARADEINGPPTPRI